MITISILLCSLVFIVYVLLNRQNKLSNNPTKNLVKKMIKKNPKLKDCFIDVSKK